MQVLKSVKIPSKISHRYPGDIMIFFGTSFIHPGRLDWLKNCKREFDGYRRGIPLCSRISHARERTHIPTCVRACVRARHVAQARALTLRNSASAFAERANKWDGIGPVNP